MKQAEISGYNIETKGKIGSSGPFGWTATATIEGAQVTADVSVLVWSDIVKSSMGHGIVATYWQMLITSWIYIYSGALRRLMWLRKGPIIAALYPIAILSVQFFVAITVASVVGSVLSTYVYPRAGWVTFIPIVIYILRWFHARDSKIYAYYLMHDFAHTAQNWGAYPPKMEERFEAFRAQIAQALTENYDEVLIVGHSSGAHIAVSIVADLLRANQGPKRGHVLGLLTLGHVVPMVSFLPKATRLRGDLAMLSTRADITWVDVTAPGDGCSFALCDPVAVSGVAPQKARWPLVFSAAFTQSLSPERWQELKRKYFRLHFQYLCAFDRPKDYDYFQITAGPKTLSARYRDRPASRSRLDVAASGYTDV
ncbi:hypothetical protein AB9F26_05875 [Falsihalocynthiibacter sp. BN13B15]|uniref:hypothetical protein n=1 Tax=Falsihalocynthiibacter sp. BN13B15 TaxID=3240871 RepID=UPI00350F0249